MIAEVTEAVMNKYNITPLLKNALSGGLYFQQAPQYQDSPYGVFYITGVTQDEIMGDADDNITEVDLQFNIFTDAEDGGAEMAELSDLFTETFDWQELFVDGFNYIYMHRENILPLGFVDDMWQTTINYALGITKN